MSVTYSVAHVADMADGRVIAGDPEGAVAGFAYDSRLVQPGQCFVALPGERADGHDFVRAACAAGAALMLVQRPVPGAGAQVQVRDPLLALGQVAALHRAQFAVPVVGITGSVGKTTAKEMTAAVLGCRWRTLKTTGNLNSEVGLPMVLLNDLDAQIEVVVLEMGMRARGEIAYLASIARPHIAVVTNVAPVHLELLGTVDNVAQAKAELVAALDDQGVAVLNADDDRVAAMARRAPGRVVAFGLDGGRAASLGTHGWVTLRDPQFEGDAGQSFSLVTPTGTARVQLPVPGRHMAQGALAAAAVGLVLGMAPADIARGLARFVPAGRRMRIVQCGGVRVVDDSYNASPLSVQSALESTRELAGNGRVWAVLGDMYELGPAAVAAHQEVGIAAARWVDELVAVGELSAHTAAAARAAGLARARHFPNRHAAGLYLLAGIRAGDTVLVKGSRGMQMEEIVSLLENHLHRLPGGE